MFRLIIPGGILCCYKINDRVQKDTCLMTPGMSLIDKDGGDVQRVAKESSSCGIVKALIFEVSGDLEKIARDSSCCSEVNMLVLYQISQGYTSKCEGKIPGPKPCIIQQYAVFLR